VQRRHQKLIEESPSPIVSDADRARIGASVCQLAKDVGYWNAGTAEFLYEDGKYYFNEVNTRLQVEHPVTEQVYGVDLVRNRSASRKARNSGTTRSGWTTGGAAGPSSAASMRGPAQQVHADTGNIKRHIPPNGNGVRVDTYLYSGFTVPNTYDSMVAKLICYGADRPQAIRKMRRALAEYDLGDLVTNRELHQVIFATKPLSRAT